jgi:hypothetical protein
MHLGGTRPWFRCPKCDARRAVLYLSKGSLGCQRCFDLGHESEAEIPAQRAVRKRHNLEALLAPGYAKPYGMRRCIYARILRQLARLER